MLIQFDDNDKAREFVKDFVTAYEFDKLHLFWNKGCRNMIVEIEGDECNRYEYSKELAEKGEPDWKEWEEWEASREERFEKAIIEGRASYADGEFEGYNVNQPPMREMPTEEEKQEREDAKYEFEEAYEFCRRFDEVYEKHGGKVVDDIKEIYDDPNSHIPVE